MIPYDACLLVFTPLYSPAYIELELVCGTNARSEKPFLCLLTLFDHSLRGNQPLCWEGTQAALWKGPHGQELRPTVNTSCERWEWILQPQSNQQ